MSAPVLPWAGLLPVFLLVGGGALVMLVDALVRRGEKWAGWIATVSILAAGVLLHLTPRLGEDGTGTLLTGSASYAAFGTLVLIGALGAVLTAVPYLGRSRFLRGEFFVLVLFSASGGVLLSGARNLLLLFVALEILTVPLYVLAGWYRKSEKSLEAALKYFLVGIFSSAFLLYGIALYYGATGTFDLKAAGTAMIADPTVGGGWLLRLSLGLMVVGIGFKLAAVPFHFWAPDVYQGAPTPVASYLAVASKAGGIAFAWRVLLLGFPASTGLWTGVLTWIILATLVLGALMALLQSDIKRLLAFSSIAHAGWILIALIAAGRLEGMSWAGAPRTGPTGTEALLLYLLIYAVSAIGAFAAVCWVERRYGGPVRIDQYNGLARRHPFLAAGLGLCMFSMAGIPPAAGFVAKYFVLWAAIRASAWLVAVVAVLTAVVGLYYYVRVVVAMYFRPHDERTAEPGRPGFALGLTMALSCAAILVLGVYPGPIIEMLRAAIG